MSMQGVQRREVRTSLVVGGLVALLVLIIGGVAASQQKTLYTAESVVVVLPRADLDTATSASYYEVLSRGEIVATFAEVANNLRFEQQTEVALQLTEEQRTSATTAVSVVPSTSVILVRASAENATTAEQMADGMTTLATEYLGDLSEPYRTEVVQTARDSAYQSSISRALLVGLAVVAALISGLALQQATYHLLTAMRRGTTRKAAGTNLAAKAAPRVTDHDPMPEKYENSWR
ncbi:hypothetical protein [Kocuria rosea]|uniref:hypothetical protein n=1 Tax=Kocuria rosea TaxID=1275 RepID=UPI0010A3D3F3|nr:hypothetical protein [Kocuria rosea]MEB2528884.1 hypothetical protein [Kocuria rosea]MEB2618789.1 hypothetical protein [Kocuria rosea]THE19444.1 hypothetical protein E1J17_00730 [Kocuria rosea]